MNGPHLSSASSMLLVALLVACSGTPPEAKPVGEQAPQAPETPDETPPETPDATPPRTTDGGSGDAQLPPLGEAETRAWLETGKYLDWACESEVHASRSPSPHGYNRICSNALVAASAGGEGEWPAGAAGVKEVYRSATDTEPYGFSVYLKLADDSDGGNSWYWYERLGENLVAASNGARICTGCHGGAGSNAASTPSPGARDYVFTPVR